MNNLIGEDLKKSFKDCLLFALNDGENPDKRIKFKFKDYNNKSFDSFTLDYFAGDFELNGVSFFGIDKDTQIKIILHNMYYDHFVFIDKEVFHGDIQCHGHGDFWGTDHYIFTYFRYKE